ARSARRRSRKRTSARLPPRRGLRVREPGLSGRDEATARGCWAASCIFLIFGHSSGRFLIVDVRGFLHRHAIDPTDHRETLMRLRRPVFLAPLLGLVLLLPANARADTQVVLAGAQLTMPGGWALHKQGEVTALLPPKTGAHLEVVH